MTERARTGEAFLWGFVIGLVLGTGIAILLYLVMAT